MIENNKKSKMFADDSIIDPYCCVINIYIMLFVFPEKEIGEVKYTNSR